ncbi:porphobilinogen synthase [Desulfitispora alkaliphila]|uniref:porphobilinogen synthase n=1 Tax=Desulfitispora alkaliphila TaxID=622674 RepID=UPI003D195A79
MYFPQYRPRRLRANSTFRNMIAETKLDTNDLVYPLFVVEGEDIKREVKSMPGVYQLSLEHLVKEVEEVYSMGIKAVLLFGIPEHKDAVGTGAYSDDGIVQLAVKKIKEKRPEITVITDVCLCEFTDHGHCGLVGKNGEILNDPTLDLLAQTALSHAMAGADMVAPSDMMDGRVRAIRDVLDANSFEQLPIMAYSAKYASAFYGPFRDAAQSAPQFGDRRTYQMDNANTLEAIRETELDIAEGADIVMVKPALSYLDIIKTIKQEFNYPVAAYNVSGEYSMIKAAAQNGWIDEEAVVLEKITSMRRAGADIIITYHAKTIANILQK